MFPINEQLKLGLTKPDTLIHKKPQAS